MFNSVTMHRRILILSIGFVTALALCTLNGLAHAQFPTDMFKGLGGAGVPSSPSTSAPTKGTTPAPGSAGSPFGAAGAVIGIIGGTQDTEEEIKIGEGVAGTVLGASKITNNEKIQKYVNLIGRYIAEQSERKELRWSFAVIETSSINAFAAPGGIIMVTKGLYDLLETEDELAAVLAHEIAHVNRQHHYSVIKKQKLIEFGSNAVQSSVGSDAGGAMASRLVGMGAELMARGLDKDAEFEADRDGMVLAARAGYDPSALLIVLDKLQKKFSSSEGSNELFFATHPSPLQRIQKLFDVSNSAIEAAAIQSPVASRIQKDGK